MTLPAALVAGLACLASPVPAQKDRLAADFEQWFRGDIGRDSVETTRVLNRLRERGSAEDGRLLLKVIQRKPRNRGEQRVQDALLRNLADRGTKRPIQQAFADWIENGKRVTPRTGGAIHEKPEAAARLLPLLGAFHPTRYRDTLQSFARGSRPNLYLAAADGLRRTGTAEALVGLASLLSRETELARGRLIARWLLELIARHRRPAKSVREAVVVAAEERLQATDDLDWKRLLLPLLLEFRSKSTVAVLIRELERAVMLYRKPKTAVPTSISFWIADVHDALRDLTGLALPAGSPEKWREFWQRERESFELQPEEKAAAARRTDRRGLFGVRVRGRKVAFLIDASSSMRRRMNGKDKPTRFARAKAEVLKVLSELEPDVRFNVLVFADEVIKFRQAPVKAEPWQLKRCRTWLGHASLGRETRLLAALRSCLEGAVATSHTPFRKSMDEVFVISDGLPRLRPHHIQEGLAKWNVGKSCRVHVICLGPGDGHEERPQTYPQGGGPGVRFLRRLAVLHGGEFRVVL